MKRISMATAALGLALSIASKPSYAEVSDPADSLAGDFPSVMTPARMKQSLQDVPASVTVITAEQISGLNISNVWDALRLVPGMQITETTSDRIIVNYHGTNARNPRRMNVLVDGISVYRPGFSEISWGQLPVAVDDIERIEVTRGPNSAVYGPNSMMAIVNIVTKHPGDVPAASATIERAGSGAYRQHARLAAQLGSTAMHLSASREGSEGYDVIDGVRPGHDSTTARRLLFRSQTKLSGQHSLGLEASYVDGKSQDPFKSQYDIGFPDRKLRDYYLAGTWNASLSSQHELQVRLTHADDRIVQRWTACYPTMAYLPQLAALWRANPRYVAAIVAGQVPSGGTANDNLLALQAITAIQALGPQALAPLCGTANQDVSEKRTDLELQDTFVFSPALRVVSGMGARTQSAQSQTYLGGKVTNNLYRLFASAEYKPATWVNLNLGAYFEHDKFVGWETAPRAAANLHISPNQALRFVVSRGIRTPDVQEQRGNFSYTIERSLPFPVGTTSQFFQTARSPGGLRSEVALAREVGYLINVPRLGLLLDFRLFDEELKHLISEYVDVVNFAPTNNNSVRLRGLETQANLVLSPEWSGFVNYAYLRNDDATTPFEVTQYSRHSGGIGVIYSGTGGWHASLAYYGSSGDGVGENSFGRTDVAVGRKFDWSGTSLDASFFLRRYDNDIVSYSINPGRPLTSQRDDQIQLGAKLSVAF